MTPPREPDRYEVQACAVVETWNAGASGLSDLIAAAIRREHEEALESAAQIADESREDGRCIAFAIRALAHPAAAPAACICRYLSGTRFENPGNCPVHPSEPAAPAPFCTCKWRLEQSIRHAPECPVVASPGAPGKGEG